MNEIPNSFFKQVEGSDKGTLYHLIFLLFVLNIWEDIFITGSLPKTGIGIKVAKEGPIIPYLMFADDCMIFCKVSIKTARSVKEILQGYCMVSDQLINYHKSSVQFSKGTERNTRAAITDIYRFHPLIA